jgi:hypothetical protein
MVLIFMYRLLVATVVMIAGLSSAPAAGAQVSSERTVLLLTGEGCRSQREAMAAALEQRPGVIHVDFSSIPDHLLVDRVKESTDEELAESINDLLGAGGLCRAAVMKSCITAGPIAGHVAP